MSDRVPIAAIIEELRTVAGRLEPEAIPQLAERIARARHVFLHGVGRNGLVMQGLTMRLAHAGVAAHFVGDLTAPPAGAGDVLVSALALGSLPTADAVLAAARRAGCATVVITARQERVTADLVVVLPAQTMADPPVSVMPLGSQFELALSVLAEALVIELMRRLGRSHADLSARHANLL